MRHHSVCVCMASTAEWVCVELFTASLNLTAELSTRFCFAAPNSTFRARKPNNKDCVVSLSLIDDGLTCTNIMVFELPPKMNNY